MDKYLRGRTILGTTGQVNYFPESISIICIYKSIPNINSRNVSYGPSDVLLLALQNFGYKPAVHNQSAFVLPLYVFLVGGKVSVPVLGRPAQLKLSSLKINDAPQMGIEAWSLGFIELTYS